MLKIIQAIHVWRGVTIAMITAALSFAVILFAAGYNML
jgi:hypothetical protein